MPVQQACAVVPCQGRAYRLLLPVVQRVLPEGGPARRRQVGRARQRAAVVMRALGIDYGSSRIAIVGPSLLVFEEVVLRPGDNFGALDVLAEITWNTVTQTKAKVVAVESPIQGMSRNVRTGIMLAMVAGAVTVAARQAGADVTHVPPASWKKEVIGFGNAKKEQVSEYLADQHPGLFAHCPSQDLVDAACLGLYAETRLA